ncbi:hypothetical protein R1flu_014600 [Riccia fluitans]|uniref:Uncharacterized protein n=1 Tax=Riccia fluitans TaxID=41844 RepID=A0ABD1YGJ8_9MARC
MDDYEVKWKLGQRNSLIPIGLLEVLSGDRDHLHRSLAISKKSLLSEMQLEVSFKSSGLLRICRSPTKEKALSWHI